MDKKNKPNSLGRGLGALLGEEQILAPSSIARIKSETNSYIKISSIEANPSQPRKDFEQESLDELATSIKTYGVIQPITVRPVESGKYQLISGERRLRASQLAGLQEIPAYVRTVD
ncbi:MAG: ParB/RepB/Spo0J family partition protein, partial [Bacteroidales bacterium]|nr:ParB/RepB/Spo0J family partition protein [Bacteroidales bacterium]